MNREEAREKAKVMIAYADGKEIECYHKNIGWCNYLTNEPLFNWEDGDYRIKLPQPKVIPFTFEDREMFVGRKVRNLVSYDVSIVTGCGKDFVHLALVGVRKYQQFLDKYVFDKDGSMCGKIQEE